MMDVIYMGNTLAGRQDPEPARCLPRQAHVSRRAHQAKINLSRKLELGAVGMATTTATSRLTSALSRAVNARTAAHAALGPRSGIRAPASFRKAPSRSASAAARMIAATVPNGPASASAAAADAFGCSPAAVAARVTPAAHGLTRRRSLDDVILADSLVTLDVMSRVLPPQKSVSWPIRRWPLIPPDIMLHDNV